MVPILFSVQAKQSISCHGHEREIVPRDYLINVPISLPPTIQAVMDEAVDGRFLWDIPNLEQLRYRMSPTKGA